MPRYIFVLLALAGPISASAQDTPADEPAEEAVQAVEAITNEPPVELPVAAPLEFNASDVDAIRAAAGRMANVRGVLLRVAQNENVGIAFLDFQRERGGFNGIIHRKVWADFEAAFGQDLRAAWEGKQVEISGTLSLHRGAPQIELSQPGQIRVLSDTVTPAAPSPVAPRQGIIPAEDVGSLVAGVGQPAQVRGIVRAVTALPGDRLTFVNFGAENSNTFTGVIRQEQLQAVRTVHGQDLNSALGGRVVIVSGTLALHRDRPQIEITDPGQITVTQAGEGMVITPTDKPMAAAPPAAATDAYDAGDFHTLVDLAGQPVRVKGFVHNVSALPDGSRTLIDFKSSAEERFSAVIHHRDLEAIEGALGQPLGVALAGRQVTVSGTISLHRGHPQIEISEASQLLIAPLAEAMPPPESATSQVHTGVYASTEINLLIARAGQSVSVEGLVDTVTTLPNESVTFINFKAVEGRQFTALIRKPHLDAVRKVFGKYLDGTLGDQIVNVTGVISIGSGRPEIEVTDPNQIKIVERD